MEEMIIVREVLGKFNQNNIRYCHWKSNEHVKEGICGLTDLDILVDKDQNAKVQELLYSCGVKRFIATIGIRYPGIEDFIGLDANSGKIVHFHIHYQLTLGEKYLKGYRLPWEKMILDTCRWDHENGVYVSDANLEMILLLVRAALKWRLRDGLSALLGNEYFRGDFKREYLWLLERVDPGQLEAYCRQLIDPDETETCGKLMKQAWEMKDFLKFRKMILKRFAPYKTYGHAAGSLRKNTRELLWKYSVFRKKYLKMNLPMRRTLSSGGIIVALIGSDGSGKSTVVKTLVEHLSIKIDVTSVYFGSGDGRSSLWRLPLKVARKQIIKTSHHKMALAPDTAKKPANAAAKTKPSLFYQTAKLLWAISLGAEKKQKLRNAWKCRNLGMVVITDRYPQTQVKGINDGPLLSQWLNHQNKWLRSFALKEWKAYQGGELLTPDLVIRLNVTPEIAASRKTDMTLEEFRTKVEIVKSLKFNTEVLDVDSNRPLPEVLLEVKKAIWAKI